MDKRFFNLMIVFFLAFGLFITLTFFNKQISTFTRAKEESIPSSETSLIFAWPLTAPIDGSQPVVVNIFIRNADNLPLSGKSVSLSTNLGNIAESAQATDKSGKVSFTLSSSTPGLAELNALVDSQIQLKQKVSVKFE